MKESSLLYGLMRTWPAKILSLVAAIFLFLFYILQLYRPQLFRALVVSLFYTS